MTFVNEPLLELRREAVRREALAALDALDAKLPLEVPMLIGEDVVTGRVFASVDPSSPTRIVAHAHEATAAHVKDAVGRAAAGPRRLVAQARRRPRRRAAARRRHPALAPPGAHRAGRPRGRQAVGRGRRRRLRGDRLPRVLRPGRARARGRQAADPAAGRAQRHALRRPRRHRRDRALELPAGDRRRHGQRRARDRQRGRAQARRAGPACAKAVVDALHAGGVPLDALALLPGGDEAGKALVADPRIHTLVFTGSCAVGLQILEQAAKVVPGQRHLKRVIAEMGGKNAVIVDSDADLDDVVPALLKSAFAFAGQKCSAASPRARARARSPTSWPSGWRARSRPCASARPRTSAPTSRR